MIRVVRPGFFTTVQDAGRHGYLAYGVPRSGAMDRFAFHAANILAGNDPDAAAFEMTLSGGVFRFESAEFISVFGSDMRAMLDGKPRANGSSFPIPAGSELSFSFAQRGCRAYLAVRGGISVPQVFGSRATYARGGFGGFRGRVLKAGDIIETSSPSGPHPDALTLPDDLLPHYDNEFSLRAIPGPHDDLFTGKGIETFFSSRYRITNRNDRMGYLLEGPLIQHKNGADIVSDPVCAGVVQVPGNGMPIVMTADCQTTGGYAKIATVIGPDIGKIAQGRMGETVTFTRCTVGDAAIALRDNIEMIEKIRTLCGR